MVVHVVVVSCCGEPFTFEVYGQGARTPMPAGVICVSIADAGPTYMVAVFRPTASTPGLAQGRMVTEPLVFEPVAVDFG
jgi:hypothetical protein